MGGEPSGWEATAVAVNPDDPQNAYLGVSREGIFTTSDGGKRWSPVTSLDVEGQSIQAIATNGTDVIVAMEQGVRISRDAGQRWDVLVISPTLTAPIRGLAMSGYKDSFLMALGKDGIVAADMVSGERVGWPGAPPTLSITSVSVSGNENNTRYASGQDVLLCRRIWYWYHREWGLWKLEESLGLGISLPCRTAQVGSF